jgi:hypothetical protein
VTGIVNPRMPQFVTAIETELLTPRGSLSRESESSRPRIRAPDRNRAFLRRFRRPLTPGREERLGGTFAKTPKNTRKMRNAERRTSRRRVSTRLPGGLVENSFCSPIGTLFISTLSSFFFNEFVQIVLS